MKNVKIAKMPGAVQEVVLDGEVTVQDALNIVEYDVEGYSIKVNGENAEVTTKLHDGDRVVLAKMIKGNSEFEVTVAQMPGKMERILLESGATVKDAIETAGFETTGFSIKVNGVERELGYGLENEDRVILAKMIKGNK